MTYADERKQAIRSRNNESKRRSREMELRIAKELRGHRVPMSGAGSIKGDCLVTTDKVGQILIECKYSAAQHHTGSPRVRFDFKWFDKLARDVESMVGTRFGAVIFRYHGKRLSDYAIIPVSVFERYDDPSRLVGVGELDAGPFSSISIIRSVLDNALSQNPRKEQLCLLRCNRGLFVIMALDIFKEMINGPDDIES